MSEQHVDLEAVEARLRERLREVLARAERVASHTRHRDEPLPADFAEQAVELENAGTLVAIDRGLADEIRALRAALERIRAGRYGFCTACGEPIAPQRLEVLPEAALCLHCAA